MCKWKKKICLDRKKKFTLTEQWNFCVMQLRCIQNYIKSIALVSVYFHLNSTQTSKNHIYVYKTYYVQIGLYYNY